MNVISSTFLVCFHFLLVAGCGAHARGTSETRRVIDGTIIEDKKGFEWITKLQAWNGTHTIHCGGSVIGSRWVLTAAHCIHFEFNYCDDVRIFPSTWYLGDTTSRKGEQCLYHPQHDRAEPNFYDIGLIKCNENLLNYPAFKIIPLTLPNVTIRADDGLLMYGWGLTQSETPEFSPSLRGTFGPVISWAECDEMFKNSAIARGGPSAKTRWIPIESFCTQGAPKDRIGAPCSGDSGGPVVRYNNELVGIISGTLKGPNDECSYTSVHTNIVDHLRWIYNIIDPSVDTSMMKGWTNSTQG